MSFCPLPRDDPRPDSPTGSVAHIIAPALAILAVGRFDQRLGSGVVANARLPVTARREISPQRVVTILLVFRTILSGHDVRHRYSGSGYALLHPPNAARPWLVRCASRHCSAASGSGWRGGHGDRETRGSVPRGAAPSRVLARRDCAGASHLDVKPPIIDAPCTPVGWGEGLQDGPTEDRSRAEVPLLDDVFLSGH